MSELDKILCNAYVLESSRDELEMCQDRIKQLFKLLSDAYQERDEARQQLQKSGAEISQLKKLLNHYIPSSSAETNLDVTEPILDYIAEANNIQSYVFSPSTPPDCISDATNSPAMSNVSLSESSNLQMPHSRVSCGLVRMGRRTTCSWSKDLILDHASTVIDNLVQGRPLPEKGKLVQAVVAAEPLLETLLLTGRLPRWRNPPTTSSMRTAIPCSVNCLYRSPLQHQSSSGIILSRYHQ